MSTAEKTTDHGTIRNWVEERGGHPARVADTAPGHPSGKPGSAGILRIDFAQPDESLERISWDEFFKTFDQNELAFLYQDEPGSRFAKFVNRD